PRCARQGHDRQRERCARPGGAWRGALRHAAVGAQPGPGPRGGASARLARARAGPTRGEPRWFVLMANAGPLPPAFCAGLPAGRAPPGGAGEALEPALEALWAAARAAYPGLQTPWEAFAPFLAERLPEGPSLEQALGEVRGPELYLACACAREEPRALA